MPVLTIFLLNEQTNPQQFWLKIMSQASDPEGSSDDNVPIQISSSAVEDEANANAKEPKRKRRKVQPAYDTSVTISGEPCVFALVACHGGRWTVAVDGSALFSGWMDLAHAYVGQADPVVCNATLEAPVLLGFLVARPYSLLAPDDESCEIPDASASELYDVLQKGLRKQRGRETKCFGWNHADFLDAAYFERPIHLHPDVLELSTSEFPRALFRDVICDEKVLLKEVIGRVQDHSLKDLDPAPAVDIIDRWADVYGMCETSRQASPYLLQPSLAHIASRGGLPFDLASCVPRDHARVHFRALHPPDRIFATYIRSLGQRSTRVKVEKVDSLELADKFKGGGHYYDPKTKGYSAGHVVRCLRASRRLSNQSKLGESIVDHVTAVSPEAADVVKETLRKRRFKEPSRQTLSDGRVRFDSACMLLRMQYNAQPNLRRQLFFDASRQPDVEVFAVKEIVHCGDGKGECRTLPLTSLGVGHYSVEDKAMTLLHSIACESGRCKKMIKHVMDTVRCTMPDGGAESTINDVPDITDMFLRGNIDAAELGELRGTWLFPKSFWIHEPMHTWDLIIRNCLFNIDWFFDFFAELKKVIAFLRDDGQRLIVQERVKELRDIECVLPLDNRPAEPFRLRWGTAFAFAVYIDEACTALELFDDDWFPRRNTEARECALSLKGGVSGLKTMRSLCFLKTWRKNGASYGRVIVAPTT